MKSILKPGIAASNAFVKTLVFAYVAPKAIPFVHKVVDVARDSSKRVIDRVAR